MILHSPPDVVYTADDDYCGLSGIDRCSDANVNHGGDDAVLVFTLAAFPEANAPRLSGVSFGIHYNGADIEIVDWGVCGDFHLYTDDWPGPGSGTAVTWSEARTSHVTEIHWFAVQSISGNPSSFDVGDHPSRGGGAYFADDSIPSILDVAVDLGKFGFRGDPGYLPCPDPTPALEASWGEVKAAYR